MTRAPREPAPSLRDRQRDAVRADIHAAAYRLFAAQGFTNVTTDDIAAEVAFVVAEAWQGKGIATDLLHRLAELAAGRWSPSSPGSGARAPGA